MDNRISIVTTTENMYRDALKVYNFWQLGRKEKKVIGVENSAENNTEKTENNHSKSLDSIE